MKTFTVGTNLLIFSIYFIDPFYSYVDITKDVLPIDCYELRNPLQCVYDLVLLANELEKDENTVCELSFYSNDRFIGKIESGVVSFIRDEFIVNNILHMPIKEVI